MAFTFMRMKGDAMGKRTVKTANNLQHVWMYIYILAYHRSAGRPTLRTPDTIFERCRKKI